VLLLRSYLIFSYIHKCFNRLFRFWLYQSFLRFSFFIEEPLLTQKLGSKMTSNVLPSPSIQMARSLCQALPTPSDVSSCDSWALFQYQVESGSTESAVDAMKRLYVVCILAGPDFTISTILPYITNLVVVSQQPNSNTTANVLSDEMLLLLGQQLMNVISHVTTNPACGVQYLPLVERMCGVEETVVRDQAVRLAQAVCVRTAECPDRAIIEAALPVWVPVVQRLQSADWFTAKVSCAGILPSVLQLANRSSTGESTAMQLLHLYCELCGDETPMVRRAAAKYLGPCLGQASGIGSTALAPEAMQFAATQVAALAHDEQDSVRLLAVAAMAQAGTIYGERNPQWCVQHWIPIVRDGATDLSW
jgi:serine/threonine-protein phosphatase 2A regulatory subunit A